MEGNTYPTRWKKQGDKFLVYLDSEKFIKGVDIDFETACEDLCLAICDRYAEGLGCKKSSPVKKRKKGSLKLMVNQL